MKSAAADYVITVNLITPLNSVIYCSFRDFRQIKRRPANLKLQINNFMTVNYADNASWSASPFALAFKRPI